ncbi:MAG TPA: MGMT family protein [Gemmatimonadaceae bacterium]|jgi:methylated-DNA-protein-cysteine methyltransferase-like protein|nr:MGMT family protein [Gemmatimonadaceae bacterium]
MTGSSSYQRIYAAVRRIPRGRVSTYGAIARVAGLAGQARQVGYALSALPAGTTVPWHRVINAQGRLSLERSASGAGITQRLRLVREGVVVDAAGRVSLEKFGWRVRGGKHAGKRAGRSVPSRATH